MNLDVYYFVIGLIAYQILKMFWLTFARYMKERREKKFLRFLEIEFEDHSKITLIAIDTSDQRAMAKLERELRAQYQLEEEARFPKDRDADKNGLRYRRGNRGSRPEHVDHRKGDSQQHGDR